VTIALPGAAVPPAEGSAQGAYPGSGTVSDTAAASGTPAAPTSQNSAPAVPKTGDTNVTWIWVTIMAAALAAAIGLIHKKLGHVLHDRSR